MQLIAIKPVGAMGRVVIPADLRRLLGLEPGRRVGIYKADDALVLKAMPPRHVGDTMGGCTAGRVTAIRVHRRPSDD